MKLIQSVTALGDQAKGNAKPLRRNIPLNQVTQDFNR